ncbi:hypothetical protein FACS189467_1590 [Bacteroidia bacterium]|nr:hypothetical protein FACS189467_1590 [Bacteroidia bacterium]
MSATIAVAAIVSCSKDDAPAPSPLTPNEDGTVTITATVENGATYNSQIDSVKVRGYVTGYVDVATVPYVNGGFSFDLPKDVAAANLTPYFDDEDLEGQFKGLTISNKDVKAFQIENFEAYKNGNNNSVGYFYYGSEDTDDKTYMNEVEVDFIYVDADCSISGSTKVDISEFKGATFNASVSLKKGWNALYQVMNMSAANDKISAVTITLTTTPQNGVKWTYYNPNEGSKISRGFGIELNQLTPAK